MKPRILVNMHYMEIGGAERALLGLLNAIDTSRVDVELFINRHTGELMTLIPTNIKLLPENKRYSTIERPIKDIIREGHIDIAIARLIAKVHHWVYKKTSKLNEKEDASIFQYVARYTTPLLPSLYDRGEYDLAISFIAPHNIVKEKVKAKRKAAWIHTDYSNISINKKMELPIWRSFNYIVSISHEVTNRFIETFPSLRCKVIELENIISATSVREQASLFKPIEYSGDYIKICSVGRFCHAKNYDNIPFIAQQLRDMGLKFKWFIVGFGDDGLITQNINKTSTHNEIIILGKKDNPYPYIANCDIYAQPSRYEGKSVTVREAQILCRPVIITNYPTSKSQIKDGIDGIICDLDNNAIATAIFDLANNSTKRLKITSYLSQHEYGNEFEIEEFYSML